MKIINTIKSFLLLSFVASILMVPAFASANAVIGEPVVTLGKDLTGTQQEAILKEMQVPDDVKIIEVTNEEEHQYLGKYLSKGTIGTKAISSAKITLTDSGKGISVKTNNITDISESMYTNAATTAGIKDVEIYVTAPFKVSGTAGLTGIIKSFEVATGKKIDENLKQVANEEIVRTSEVAEEIKDPDKAAEFMNRVKEKISKEKPQTSEDYKNIIINVANEFNLNLNQETINRLSQFFQKYSSLNIDWDQIKSQLGSLRENIKNIDSEQVQSFFDKFLLWFENLFLMISNNLKKVFN